MVLLDHCRPTVLWFCMLHDRQEGIQHCLMWNTFLRRLKYKKKGKAGYIHHYIIHSGTAARQTANLRLCFILFILLVLEGYIVGNDFWFWSFHFIYLSNTVLCAGRRAQAGWEFLTWWL